MKCPRCKVGTMRKNGFAESGNQRWICKKQAAGEVKVCYKTTNPTTRHARDQGGREKRTKKLVFKRALGRSVTNVIVTAAQNATPVHKAHVEALKQACNDLSAELLVVPYRYQNPTSRWTDSQENAEVWAPEITPYLWNTRKRLNQNLMVVGDVKIQPTATNPLTGFDAITHAESGIFGHPKLQLRTVATPQGRLPKIITTTGTCTVPNYTDSRAGKLGEFHHTQGAILVQIAGRKVFHMRQLNAHRDSGMFSDMTNLYGADWSGGKVVRDRRIAGLVCGDWHEDATDPAVIRATVEMIKVLKPRHIVLHDLFNGGQVNHHERHNPFHAMAHIRAGRAGIADAVQRAADRIAWFEKIAPSDCKIVVVNSNHDRFLDEWIKREDWKKYPADAEFYLETARVLAENTELVDGYAHTPSAFKYWLDRHLGFSDSIRTLDRDESFLIEGIETGMHMDDGPNGARGSLMNMRRIGVKFVGAHVHAPGINEGGMCVGTSSFLKQGYNHGPSGWLQTHAWIYQGGKRTLSNIIGGEFHA